MRFLPMLALVAVALTLTGCHSAYIETTVSNRTPDPISLLEVDYPSASFGSQSLAAGAEFHYRFKVIGAGPATVSWTDTAHHEHKASGPVLYENDEGSLAITLNPAGADWVKQLTSSRR